MAAARRKGPGADDWPLGAFLRSARGMMSIREAARRAEISESRWRQVEAGYQQMAGGIKAPVSPRPETIAAMCKAISADIAEGLRLAGHNPEQYGWLFEDTPNLDNDVDRAWFAALPREDREQILAELQRVHVDAEIARAAGPKSRKKAV